ncbi:RNase HII [Eubacterium uniforme]|uniref:Ribonuclease HII n=1 Tax=Eubacterium uniforme TaxID=39495 RepID=A0A1T4V605_9FIRM|nr:ribonuclease HII [Eubacterium uniforme]SKA60379.1 RNase HII [Eubacterium uniforme]
MSEKLPISEIKKIFDETDVNNLGELIQNFKDDERSGVVNIIKRANKRIDDYNKELKRLEIMNYFENTYDNFEYICGIDEVGRGPFAGPVVAGAVILPKGFDIMYINDSKKLSEAKREELNKIILENAIDAQVGVVSAWRIDETDILRATYEAMRIAIEKLKVKPSLLLNDAVKIPEVDIKQVSIIKGDAKCKSIAAASIVAKVYRDHLMEEYDEKYPQYEFAKNKGYGTAAHIEAIKKYGLCEIHRRSFTHSYV